MLDITPDQWSFIDETAADFKVAVRLLGDRHYNNEIEQHLAQWALFLGVLAVETIESIAALLRAEKLRGAFMLGRPLMEYHVRLRYYIIQAEPKQDGMRKNPHVPPEKIYAQVDAIKDWNNADAKMADLLQYRIKYVSDLERNAILETISERQTLHERAFKHMCETVGKEDGDLWDLAYPQFRTQSSFLHGDQAAISDVVRIENKHLSVYFNSPAMSAISTLAESAWFFVGLYESFQRISGWSYGSVRASRRLYELFQPAIEAASVAIDVERAELAASASLNSAGL